MKEIEIKMNNSVKDFLVKYKSKILKMLLAIASLLVISLLAVLILFALKVIYFDSGIKFNIEIFSKFTNTWYGYLLYILLQCIITSLLSFVPGVSMAYIVLSTFVYTNPLKVFLLSFMGVMLSSFCMYFIGRLGGYKVCEKILGKEDCDNAMRLLREHSTVYFPLMMVFPLFPDDALIMLAGTIKMSLSWFLPSVIIGRAVGIATIVFGFAIVPFDSFKSLYDWIIFITVCAFWVIIAFKLAHKLNIYMEKKRKNQQTK